MLIAVLDVMEYLQRLLVGRRFHLDFLESTFQRTVFLYRVAVFIERCGTDTLYRTPCQRGFHDVRSIHAARCRSSTDDGVYLVDEHDHIGVGLQLLHECLQSLLKLSAILCASHYARHVEGVDALAEEHGTGVVLLYELCQSFHDGTLAHTRFTY